MSSDANAPDLRMDATQLYREEVYTDQRIGTIRCLTPITSDGAADPSRPRQYVGSAQLLTPAGPLPMSFEIEAQSLAEAVSKFGERAQQAFEETMEELKELRRQSSSSIVVPSLGTGGGVPGGGMPGGGTPGGGIQMP